MSLSLYEISVPSIRAALGSLSTFLEKAEAHVAEQGYAPAGLLDARLFPDMFPFASQIQMATDLARRGVDRLEGKEPSRADDVEASFAELKARVAYTAERVEAAQQALIDDTADKRFEVRMGREDTREFTGRSYATGFLLPNIFFHVVTAYNILRHNGVRLGKRDYLAPFVKAPQA